MRKEKSKHYIDTLMGLVAFGVFACCILSVLLSGAGIYKRLTARDGKVYEQRSCTQYVAMKLRQASSAEAVSLLEYEGGTALCIVENINGHDYNGYIYCADGSLRELFAPAGDAFDPAAGEKLMELKDLSFSQQGSLLSVSLTESDGRETELYLSLRGGEGAA